MHELCKGCKWNNYPVCTGTKMFEGEYMTIEHLNKDFQCGQKDRDIIMDFSIREKTKLELLEERVSELEKISKS